MSGVYIFPSDSERNIEIGIKAGIWAVPIQKAKPSIVGKARSMGVGDWVLLYLTREKEFFGLFRVTNCPDDERVISDIWDGRYELPFGIALCSEQKRMSSIFAPRLMNILPSLRNLPGAWSDHITKFRGMTIFQRQELSKDDIAALTKEFLRRLEEKR